MLALAALFRHTTAREWPRNPILSEERACRIRVIWGDHVAHTEGLELLVVSDGSVNKISYDRLTPAATGPEVLSTLTQPLGRQLPGCATDQYGMFITFNGDMHICSSWGVMVHLASCCTHLHNRTSNQILLQN